MKKYFEFINENNSSDFIDEKTLKDIFIDLLDIDFSWQVIDHQSIKKGHSREKWYLDIRKVSDSNLGYIQRDGAYGVTNLQPMKIDISKILDILEDAKKTLNSMDYTVGYEIEFHFNDENQFFISCHIQHNDTIDNDEGEDDDVWW